MQNNTTDSFTVLPRADVDLLRGPEHVFAKYRRHLDHLDLSDAQKAELVFALWQITGSFVDRAFGDDAAQLCRKDGDENQLSGEGGLLPVISSEDYNQSGDRTLTTAFRKRAGRERRKEKR